MEASHSFNVVECTNITRGTPHPFWSKEYKVADEPLTLLAWQITALSLFPHFLHYFLKHLGQPLFVSQVMGGIIFGPSILGAPAIDFAQTKNTTMQPTLLQQISLQTSNTVFGQRSHAVLDTLALFGSMFFMFKLGVMSDPTLIKRAGLKAVTIGFCCYAVSLVAGLQMGDIIKSQSEQLKTEWAEKHDPTRKTVILSSMTSYPVITCALTDLNIINSDIGHLATSSTMVIEIFNFIAQTGFLTIRLFHKGHVDKAYYAIASTIGFLGFIYFMIRPAMVWVARRIPEGGPVKEIYIFSVFVLVLICGFMSEYVGGLNAMMSVFLLGLAVPDGPPLGAAIVQKLEYLVKNLLMPLHLALLGLKINVNDVTEIWLRGQLILFFTCFLGKFVGLIFPAIYFGIPVLDVLLLGLIMNLKGIIELAILNLWCDAKSIDTKASASLVFIMLLTTAIITPLVKHFYDPRNRYLAYKKRSITSSKNNPEFRLLVCIHEQEDIPPILKLLQISTSTKGNTLCVYLLHLIELIGRASPLLKAHSRKKTTSSRTTKTERIVNTFLNFEEYQTLVTIQPFSATSPCSSMHNDIVDMAAEKKTFLIIFPYQKQQNSIDGTTRITKKNQSLILANLLTQAPCSVGILANRNGNLGVTNKFAPSAPSVCHVVLFFLGGADDREALEYALTIAEQPSLILTVVQFISPDTKVRTTSESIRDADAIESFRVNVPSSGGKKTYSEVAVKDGAETSWAIRSVMDEHDLIIVGRRHDPDSNFTSGLNEWNECEELGIIGDLIASSDCNTDSMLLVVQKQDV